MDPSALTKDNLIAILSDPKQRNQLEKAMKRESGSHLPLSNRYYEIALICIATPEELHAIVKTLMLFKHRYDAFLSPLVFHRNMPEQTLFLLLERRRCLTELGHRRGPQKLLEQMASRHRYSESITTLAISYYSEPDYPTEAFAAFLREHADDGMLRGNILRCRDLPPDKAEVVKEIFGTLTEKKRG